MSISFEYVDEHGRTAGAKKEWFVGRAISDAIGLNKKEKLIICVEHELEELWGSDYACTVLAKLIKHDFDLVKKDDYSKNVLISKIKNGELKQRGWSFGKTKSDAVRNPILWQRVHYWNGKGLPIWDKTKANETACAKAAEGYALTPESVHKIYLAMAKKKSIGNRIMAKHWFLKGESER